MLSKNGLWQQVVERLVGDVVSYSCIFTSCNTRPNILYDASKLSEAFMVSFLLEYRPDEEKK